MPSTTNRAGRPSGPRGVPRSDWNFRRAARKAASTIASATKEICVVTVRRLCSRMMSP